MKKMMMHKFLTASAISAFLLSMPVIAPAAFQQDSLVVYRIDSSSAATTAQIFLDEYSLTGALRSSVAIPTTTAGSHYGVVGVSTSNDEGALSLSPNKQYITFGGYNSPVGVSSNNAINPNFKYSELIAARVDMAGNIDTRTTIGVPTTDPNGTTRSIRDVATTDGTKFWATGVDITYTTLGSTSGGIPITSVSARNIEVVGGNLYVSTSANTAGGGRRINQVGSGLPTTGGQTFTAVNSTQFPVGSSAGGFVLLDNNPSVAGLDTMYVADANVGFTLPSTDLSRGVMRYDFNGTTWVATYNLKTTVGALGSTNNSGGTFGVTAVPDGLGSVNVYATTLDGRIVAFADTATPGSSAPLFSEIVGAEAGRSFRGVVAVPEPASLALLGLGALALGRRRRV